MIVFLYFPPTRLLQDCLWWYKLCISCCEKICILSHIQINRRNCTFPMPCYHDLVRPVFWHFWLVINGYYLFLLFLYDLLSMLIKSALIICNFHLGFWGGSGMKVISSTNCNRYSSFFLWQVKDTVQVDQNVSRHLGDELSRDDWDLMVSLCY